MRQLRVMEGISLESWTEKTGLGEGRQIDGVPLPRKVFPVLNT